MAKHLANVWAVLTLCVVAGGCVSAAAQQQVSNGPASHLQQSRGVAQTPAGSPVLLNRLSSGERKAISLAAGDFFHDGRNGLVTGYSLGEGGVIGVQQGTALPRHEEAETSAAFADKTRFVEVGLRPDFLLSTDLTGAGHQDLVAAAHGGQGLSVLLGDGQGGFQPAKSIPVEGRIASLTAWKGVGGKQFIVVGVCGSRCSVDVYGADGSRLARVPVTGSPSISVAANVNGGPAEDLIVGDSSALMVIDGRTVGSSSPHVTRLPISGAAAVAVGSFVFDRRGGLPQIGVLTADGSVHFLARTGLIATAAAAPSLSVPGGRGHSTAHGEQIDPATLTWFDAETLSGIAAPDSGVTPLLVRTRLSGSGMDDLLALNVNGGGRVSVAHPVVATTVQEGQPRQPAQVLPARVQSEGSSTGGVLAALPMRTSQDARLGLVTAEGTSAPMIAQLGAYHTIYVTTTADSAVTGAQTTACQTYSSTNTGCTLRAAIGVVNTDATYNEVHGTADTVTLPAGTITLSYSSSGSGTDSNGNYNYHIEVNGPMNLIGQGAASTLISANNLDKVFSINPGYTATQVPMDIFMSNLTLENGTNKNSEFANINANGVGGLLDYDTTGTGYITFANCVFTAGLAEFGEGGAVFVSDNLLGEGSTGTGTLEVDGGTFSNNHTAENGGAISTATTENIGNVPIVINGVTFTGNQAEHSYETANTNETGFGGAIDFERDEISGKTPMILNSTFTNNATTLNAGHGTSEGGAVYAGSGMTITNSIFTGNTAQTSGGAVEMTALDYHPTLTGLTVTGNSAPDSAGIEIDAATPPGGLSSTVQYNRISGNTNSAVSGSTTTTRSGLGVGANIETDPEASVDARYNFWGCNGAATGTGCNTASVDSSASSGTLTLTPYAAVTASLSSTTPAPGSTLTLNGGITTDSNNAALSNVNAFTGVAGGTSSTASGVTVTNPGGQVTATLTISENSSALAGPTTSATNSSGAAPSLSTTVTASGSGTGTVKIDNATATVDFTVTVLSPTISIAFGASTIPLNGSTLLTFTLTNPNLGVALNGVAFSDALPSGLVVSSNPAVTNACGGTVTATAGTGTISLSGGTINANTPCTMTVSVTGTTAGQKANTTGPITANNESASGLASNTAVLTVLAPPTIAKAFGASSIPAGGATTLTFTLTNPGASAQSGIAFTDTFPAGLTIATPNGLTGACGGTVTATAGSSSVTLSGGSLAGSANCTIVVNVTDSTSGSLTNTTGSVSSTQAGTGLTASATLMVNPGPTATFSVTGLAGFPAPGIAGTATVTARDAYGNLTPSFTGTVTLSSSDPLAAFSPASYTFVAGDMGAHSFAVTLNTAGTQTVTATSSTIVGTETGIVVADSIFLVNQNGIVDRLNSNGVSTGTSGTSVSNSTSGAIALDNGGNAWSVTSVTSGAIKTTRTLGTSTTYTGGGISHPLSLAIDGLGQVWVANTTNTVSVLSNAGTAVSPNSGYTNGVLNVPGGILIDSSGVVWISNSGNNTVAKVFGGAAPVATPAVTATSNVTQGARP